MALETMALRLCLAVVLGGIVGMERENKRRAAGFRTHILVSVGAALVMVTSESMFLRYQGLTNLDPARLGAQVISGIGFLGAGTIIRQGPSVKGLTTAASLWAVSCIGLAAGSGNYMAATVATGVVYLTLILLGRFERLVVSRQEYTFELALEMESQPGKIGEVTTLFGKLGVNIKNIVFETEDEGELVIRFQVKLPKGLTKEALFAAIAGLEKVTVLSPELP